MNFTVRLDEMRDSIPEPPYAQDKAYEALTVPLHQGVAALGFVSRSESWKNRGQGYELKSLSYTIGSQVENLFLAFYRLVPREPKSKAYSEHKTQYLKALEAHWKKSGVWVDMAEHVYERQQRLLAALKDDGWIPWSKELVTDARLIAGLGYKGALEVGLTLHPLYGFPYLPGTAVKGIARAYAEVVVGLEWKAAVKAATDDVERKEAERKREEHLKLMQLLFGSPDKYKNEPKKYQVGAVRFFDALPATFPKLDVDVMTPHFGPYYMKDNELPGDWHDPKPVPFLTVGAGQPFCFSFAIRHDAAAYLDTVETWLRMGLAWLGAGGKTAAGYGYFLSHDEREAEHKALEQTVDDLKRAKEEAYRKAKEEKWMGEPLPKVGPKSRNARAQVVRPEGRKLVVYLRAVGHENVEIRMEGQYNPDGFKKGEWVLVDVEQYDKRSKRVKLLRYVRRAR